MVLINKILLLVTLAYAFSGCGEDTTEPGVEPSVLSCGDWGNVENNQCGGIWARSCNVDGRKCQQIWDCGQRYWSCQ